MAAGHSPLNRPTRNHRPARRALRRPLADESGSPESELLDLQRKAGNRAVASLFGGTSLQREISLQPGDLEVGRAWTTKLYSKARRAVGAQSINTYDKIVNLLRAFQKTNDTPIRLLYADTLAGLCEYWLADHDGKGSTREANQHRLIDRLHLEALREAGIQRAQMIYLEGFDSSQTGGGFKAAGAAIASAGRGQNLLDQPDAQESTGFQAIGQYTRQAVNQGKPLARGKATKKKGTGPAPPGTSDEAVKLISEYNLSAAEVAAIRTYTVADYAYINPSMVNPSEKGGRDWLESTIKKAGPGYAFGKVDVDKVGAEGALHAGMLSQALAKVKPYNGRVYRGQRTTPEKFQAKFQIGKNYSFGAFGSSSKRQSVARGYADGIAGDTRPAADETVSVLMICLTTNGRDVSKLSAAVQQEDEVIILPGSVFQIQDVQWQRTGPIGYDKVPANAWYTVLMKQVK